MFGYKADTKVRNATYRQIPTLLADKVAFTGNTMSAQWERTDSGHKVYYVYSYRTIIASYFEDGIKSVSENYYSVTTSRHQNLCRAWL